MSSAQLQLRTHGYLKRQALVSRERCAELTQELKSAAASIDPANDSLRLEDPAEAAIASVLQVPALRTLVTQLLGPSWVLVVNRHNHVVIDRGDGSRATRMHRDLLHWSRNPITVLLMLDCAENDPLAWPSLLPGSHLWPTAEQSNGGGYWLDETPESEQVQQALKVPMSQGDVLVMDGMTFHAAGAGSPEYARVMMSLCLRTADELTGEVGTNEQLIAGSVRYEGQSRWRAHG
ncbi:phytanoyl-CoA dioxygenase family protein [Kribbella sp. NPDC051586]|uniref:phytanoyl-CoA dioxygenase family protein n=1 Tax=Kribbella sp. NPDC051586 TaxID=3364118 RepID=UPI0037ACC001